jgi:hypothetical protein
VKYEIRMRACISGVYDNNPATTIVVLALFVLITACGAERGGAPAVSPDKIVTAVLPSNLTFAPEDTVSPTPVARVTDGVGRSLPNVAVAFAVTDGGGTLEGANAVTDAGGFARPQRWVVGPASGGHTFTHYPYRVPAGTQILTWHVFEDPKTGRPVHGERDCESSHSVPATGAPFGRRRRDVFERERRHHMARAQVQRGYRNRPSLCGR